MTSRAASRLLDNFMLPLWSTSTPKVTGPWSREAEVDDGPGRAVLENLEVVAFEVADRAAAAVLDDRVDRNQTHAAAETSAPVAAPCTGAVTSAAASRPTIPFSHVCFMTASLHQDVCQPRRFAKSLGSARSAQGRAKSCKNMLESCKSYAPPSRSRGAPVRDARRFSAAHRVTGARARPRLRCRRHGRHPVGLQSGHGAHQHVPACR